jgi:hypothetical protein
MLTSLGSCFPRIGRTHHGSERPPFHVKPIPRGTPVGESLHDWPLQDGPLESAHEIVLP